MLEVYIIGIGPGNPDLLTKEASCAIAKSNVLIGDKRMLSFYETSGKITHTTIKTSEIVDIISKLDPIHDVVGILVSGDVGFFQLNKNHSRKINKL
jgi:Precorrin-6B methylase 1